MKTTTTLLAALFAISPAIGQDDHAHAHWIADFDEAAALAKKENKNLLVDFTGSDWCGWCIRLHEEVFDHAEFSDPVTKDYVLVALDFPNGEEAKAKVPNPERNQELQGKYGIRGFPSILLMTPDGEVFGRTGYQEGGPVKYVEHLNEIATKGKADLAEVKALVKQADAASGEELERILSTATDKLAGLNGESAGVGALADLVRRAMEVDADNAKGLKLAAIDALLSAGQIDDTLIAAATEMDPKNEKGLLEKVVAAKCKNVASQDDVVAALAAFKGLHEAGVKDEEIAKELYTTCAYWSERFNDDHDTAVIYAKKALEMGAEGRAKKMLDDIVNG